MDPNAQAELARQRRHLKVMYGIGIVSLLFIIIGRVFAW